MSPQANPTTGTHDFVLMTGGTPISLKLGTQLKNSDLPGLVPSRPGRPVAEVVAHPQHPDMLGLKNHTTSTWQSTRADGTSGLTDPDRSVQLSDGLTITVGTQRFTVQTAQQPAYAVVNTPPNMPVLPNKMPAVSRKSLSLRVSQLIPVISKSGMKSRANLLAPGIITVMFIMALLLSQGRYAYIVILSLYLALASYYAVYRICGKQKPWWVLTLTGVATMIFLVISIDILYKIDPITPLTGSLPLAILTSFLGPGLREEFIKGVPVLAAWFIGSRLKSPLREKVGVLEPLDGILLAAASGTGFTLLETMIQYVPNAMKAAGPNAALELMIPRIIGNVTGHLAYSGCLGYSIGLAVLIPKHRLKILLSGFLTACFLHGLWDGVLSTQNVLILLIGTPVAGILAYACLIAAIMKARQISPGRKPGASTVSSPI